VKKERTLIIVKPDGIQRNLLGEVISRFEKKGLKIIGMKMVHLQDVLLEEHYKHLKDKPFFSSIKNYMKSSPVVVLALEGINAISATRLIVGPTKGYEADAGSIRGDLSISGQSNLVHASDSKGAAEEEVRRFFSEHELFSYQKIDDEILYSNDEKE
jgi:nucleoside-diphosphate kinase